MEEFLEIILKVEREATQLQDEARKNRAEIERRYRLGLGELEEKALGALADELRALDAEAETRAAAEGEEILREGRRQVDRLRQRAEGRRDEALRLVARLLLGETEGGAP